MRFLTSLSKIFSTSAAAFSQSLLNNSNQSVRFYSALLSIRVYSAATRWSHGANWRLPASLRAQTRIVAPSVEKFERTFATIAFEHAYKDILTTLHKPNGGEYGKFYSLQALNDSRIDRLPYSVWILLESAIRNCDNFQVTTNDVEKIIDWENASTNKVEVPFKPARVTLQDFSGVPVVVDLAAMRDAMKNLGSDPNKINPQVPVDLVFDHSVQVYGARPAKYPKGMRLESDRNWERFMFLKWGSSAFYNMMIASPESRIVHQVDLEYLGRVVFNSDGLLYPDSVVNTCPDTTMIGGLGVAGWVVGGIEAEAAILGQPISMLLPSVVGFKLCGKLRVGASIADLVPTMTQMLKDHGVYGKIVEFYGEGISGLSLNDRARIANMSPHYGAIMGFFPVDHVTLEYLKLKGRNNETVAMIESYLRANKMFVDYNEPQQQEKAYTSCLQLDLGDIEPCIYGPKLLRHRVYMKAMKTDWKACLDNPLGIKGFAIPKEQQDKIAKFSYRGQPAELNHGSVVIANITSGSTISSPTDMIIAALVAKKAYDFGLEVKPWVVTSVATGYGAVTEYLLQSGFQEYLEKLGFQIVSRGLPRSIRGSGILDDSVETAISENDIVAAVVFSCSKFFENRFDPCVKANYLASPPLVVAYALAGTVNINFETESLGTGKDGKSIHLRDIWPSNEEITQVLKNSMLQNMFKSTYETITKRNLVPLSSTLYSWDPNSTYIHEAPFLKNMPTKPPGPRKVKDAYCLLNFGDKITNDHISPAGTIHEDSPAAKFLIDRYSMSQSDFNSYGSRRGNHEVMRRGTFANIRIVNKLLEGEVGPKTVHIPTREKLSVFDAAGRYNIDGHDMIILAGSEYGIGFPRDWAAKGPKLLGVKAIIAKSFDSIHRSNLVSVGILPLSFKSGEDVETLGLTGHERYTIHIPSNSTEIKLGQNIIVTTDTAISFACVLRLDTELELAYYDHDGMLPYIIRSLSNN